MTGFPPFDSEQPRTACSICAQSIPLETCKTDECGRAVHENCYVRKTITRFRADKGLAAAMQNVLALLIRWTTCNTDVVDPATGVPDIS